MTMKWYSIISPTGTIVSDFIAMVLSCDIYFLYCQGYVFLAVTTFAINVAICMAVEVRKHPNNLGSEPDIGLAGPHC